MAIIPGATQFIGISPEIDLTEKKSSRLNSETQPYTLNDIKDSVAATPAGSTGQIQFNNAGAFGASSSLFWDNTNSRLGIGTSSPTAQLTIGNTDFVVGANAGYSTYYGSAINGTIQATSSGSTTQLWFRSTGNAVNQNSNYWGRIEQGDNLPMRILSGRYTTLILGNDGYNNAITLYNASANVMPKIGINQATPTALLQITGTGSTSATTSLLVQNSAGTDSLSIKDDGYATFRNNINAANGRFFIENNGNQLKIVNPYVGNYFYIGPSNVCGVDSIFTTPNLYAGPLVIGSGGAYQGTAMSLGNFTSSNVGMQYGLQINSNYANNGAGGPNYGKQVRFYDNLISSVQCDMTFAYVNPTINYTAGGNGTIVGYDFNPNVVATTTNTTLRAFQSSLGGVYINTTSYNASAILQADSTTQGFLPPRMTTTQINAIASPAVGLMAYNTTLDCPVFYSAAGWRKISHSAM